MPRALMLVNFSEYPIIGVVLEEFSRNGWTYDGFLPGPTTEKPKAALAPTTVDQAFIMVFSKDGTAEIPPRLANWEIQIDKRNSLRVIDRLTLITGEVVNDILGPL